MFITKILLCIQMAVVVGKLYHLHSDKCRRYYNPTMLDIPSRTFSNDELNFSAQLPSDYPYVFEDGNENSRFNSAFPYVFWGTQVTVVHEFKFVFIGMRKAASSEINSIIEQYFGVRPFKGCTETRECLYVFKYCTATCLSDEELSEYFFFTFVRDPWTRFLSALIQANYVPSDRLMENALFYMMREHLMINEHLITQSSSLFGPVHNFSLTVPLHYIGKMENLGSDIKEIFSLIGARSGKKYSEAFQRFLEDPDRHFKRVNARSPQKSLFFDSVLSSASDLTRMLVADVYGQDFACLDYNPPVIGRPMCAVDGVEAKCVFMGERILHFSQLRFNSELTFMLEMGVTVDYKNHKFGCGVTSHSFDLFVYLVTPL